MADACKNTGPRRGQLHVHLRAMFQEQLGFLRRLALGKGRHHVQRMDPSIGWIHVAPGHETTETSCTHGRGVRMRHAARTRTLGERIKGGLKPIFEKTSRGFEPDNHLSFYQLDKAGGCNNSRHDELPRFRAAQFAHSAEIRSFRNIPYGLRR